MLNFIVGKQPPICYGISGGSKLVTAVTLKHYIHPGLPQVLFSVAPSSQPSATTQPFSTIHWNWLQLISSRHSIWALAQQVVVCSTIANVRSVVINKQQQITFLYSYFVIPNRQQQHQQRSEL